MITGLRYSSNFVVLAELAVKVFDDRGALLPQSYTLGRGLLFAAAAEAMRQILLDHAKANGRQKRGGMLVREAVNLADVAAIEDSEEILALDEAVCRLEQQYRWFQ